MIFLFQVLASHYVLKLFLLGGQYRIILNPIKITYLKILTILGIFQEKNIYYRPVVLDNILILPWLRGKIT